MPGGGGPIIIIMDPLDFGTAAAYASFELMDITDGGAGIEADVMRSPSLTQQENSHRLSPHPATWRPPSSQQEKDSRHWRTTFWWTQVAGTPRTF